MIHQTFPKRVTLTEVGPRDGFQFEPKMIPTDLKIEIIRGLIEAGLKRFQVASFVHPRLMPQMADAEAVLSRLPQIEDVTYIGLALNTKGVERAHHAGLKHIEISISSSDAQSRRNTGMSLDQAMVQGKEMVRLAQTYGMTISANIQCSFGCADDEVVPLERVSDIALGFMKSGVHALSIADTSGMATPMSLATLMDHLLRDSGHGGFGDFPIPVGLHLHDTRGLGLVNVMTAMTYGIAHFDTSLGGMGGCPFLKAAAGNIATEDTAYLMESMNIETGIDISKVAKCAKRLEKFLGKPFSGKIYRLDI